MSLSKPVMTASGTSGHGAELQAFFDLSELGAVVVKSLASFAHPGNPAPRVRAATAGMLNSVGLEGKGVRAWREEELPRLERVGAKVVVSIWGRRIEEFFSRRFFSTEFWFLWSTIMGSLPEHSAIEFRRYMNRFLYLFPDLSTMSGVLRSPFNQHEAFI